MNRTPIALSEPPLLPDTPLGAAHDPLFVKPKFDALLLVCGRCAERSSGPSKRKAKKLGAEFKKALGAQRPRFRILDSSCLGLCPKKATAVAAAVGDAPLRLAAVRGKSDVQAMAERLRGRG